MLIGADQTPDILLDTSVAVALLVADHELHARTVDATRGMHLGLAGHAWFETYSVVTRLPGAARRNPATAHELLERNFPGAWFLDPAGTAALGAELARLGIGGGSVYDALIGAAARHYDMPLLTSDRRAMRTYAALGIRVQQV